MICAHRDHQLELEPLQRRHALPARALQTIRAHHCAPEALLLEGLHECDGSRWFGFIVLLWFEAFLRLKDLKTSRKGDLSKDALGLHRDQPIGNRAQSANIVSRHLSSRFPLVLIARLINTHKKRPLFSHRLDQLKPLLAARRYLPGRTRQKVVSCVRRVAPDGPRNGGQGFSGECSHQPRCSAVQYSKLLTSGNTSRS